MHLRLLSFLAFAGTAAFAQTKPTYTFPVKALTAEEELKTIELPNGYSLELVLSDPIIKEPTAIAFDGNGKMYIVEMRTYMQDIDGTDELTPKSRISLHESTKGDGVFDKHSVYLDNILLPRMVLPLDDRVLVGITDTNDITLHRDANGDGVADEQSPWYVGGPRGGNMEHQPSGLVWGLDNWIYTTYNGYRLRWNGKDAPLKENTAPNGGQWGLAQDDYGKMWWSNAGGEKGLWNYQAPILYAAINVPQQKSEKYDTVWPIVALGDFQGGPGRFHSPEDLRLNHFTGCAGQTVYRGDRLPKELYGNVFLPEPVGRLIRRSIVEVKDGITTVTNPYEAEMNEFIRSSDPNFRPLNMTTGPDGCLYIVDAYRGIIQEGNWVKPGSFLRGAIEPTGMQHVTGHGRVWRLVHKDFKPGPQPKMIGESAAQLVTHLTHANGFWRDTAQRMLVVKNDKSVVPALIEMAAKNDNHLARLHALWTLEGLDAITPEIIHTAMKDAHPQLRASAIRVAETLLKKGDTALIADIKALRADKDPTVVLQTLYTSRHFNWPNWKLEAQTALMTSTSVGVREIGAQLLVEAPKISGSFTKDEKKQLERGQEIFRSLCFACHGFDGNGMPIAGREGATLAPPLAGSKTAVQGDAIIRVMMNGLAGPINDKTYEAQMVPMATNNDQWIADVTSYIRKAFGNNGRLVQKKEVEKLRKELSKRITPWTVEELQTLYPQPLPNRAAWNLTASHGSKDLGKAVDGDTSTRWDTHISQSPDMWFQIDLPEATDISGLVLDTGKSHNDYPRQFLHSTSAAALTASSCTTTTKRADKLIIDTHQHLWGRGFVNPPWLKTAPEVLRHDFLTPEYVEATHGLNVKAIYMEVDVAPKDHIKEADAIVAQIRARNTPTIAATIGGRPASADFESYVQRYAGNGIVKGLRQVLHGPSTPAGYCLRPDFVRGVQALGKHGLNFELTMRPTELYDALKLIQQCPETHFVLDHCGNGDPKAFNPKLGPGLKRSCTADGWKRGIDAVAAQPGVMCKISGIVAFVPPGEWRAEDLAPVVNHCLDAFGPNRVFFGGDWPVCLLGSRVRGWVEALDQIVASRPFEDQRKLWSGNATKFYRL